MELPRLPEGLAHFATNMRPAKWSHADYAVPSHTVGPPSLSPALTLAAILGSSYPRFDSIAN